MSRSLRNYGAIRTDLDSESLAYVSEDDTSESLFGHLVVLLILAIFIGTFVARAVFAPPETPPQPTWTNAPDVLH